MAEWTIAPVLKTGIPSGIVGSNPTPSATISNSATSNASLSLNFLAGFSLYLAFQGSFVWPRRGQEVSGASGETSREVGRASWLRHRPRKQATAGSLALMSGPCRRDAVSKTVTVQLCGYGLRGRSAITRGLTFTGGKRNAALVQQPAAMLGADAADKKVLMV